MKKKTIISSAFALLALVAITGASIPVLAASNNGVNSTNSANHLRRGLGVKNNNLTGQANFEAKKIAREQGRTEIQSALKANDYQAWVLAEKKFHGENSPILTQVNSANFAKFVEAHNYLEKGRALLDEMGVKTGMKGMEK